MNFEIGTFVKSVVHERNYVDLHADEACTQVMENLFFYA